MKIFQFYNKRGGRMKPKRSGRITYTKKMMTRIITVALIDMQFPFLLAFLGRQEIAETMGGLLITEIIGVFLVYCAKSFFETKESEKTRLHEMQAEEPCEHIIEKTEETI